MSTNELYQQLSLLKVVDIHTVNVLSFVNECRSGRCPTLFSSYCHIREAGYRVIVFRCLWQEPISVKVLVKSKVPGYGYEIISSTWLIIICLKKKLQKDYHETLYWNLSLNLLHPITFCTHALLLSWYHTYLLHVVSWDYKLISDPLILKHSFWECNVLDTSGNNKIFPLAPCLPPAVSFLK